MMEAFHLFRDLIAIEPFPPQWSVLGMHSCHIIMKTLRVSKKIYCIETADWDMEFLILHISR